MIGAPRTHVAACASTQLLLGADDPEGAIATADHQTSGRGRLGRRWVDAPATSVMVSVLLRPPEHRRAAELSLVAAAAVAAALDAVAGVTAQLKWPNDVLLDGRKVAGILAEMRGDAVILGIGVNVNQTAAELPADTRIPPVSLRVVDGVERDREAVLGALLQELDVRYTAWRQRGLEAVADELRARDVLRGRAVVAAGAAGTAAGIDEHGRLLVGTGRGTIAVESGEVELA
jgi:BirA family transcriptional regulator, biotin operon repressor / biotin---[acetyl-CoA-carboxylase] ligase